MRAISRDLLPKVNLKKPSGVGRKVKQVFNKYTKEFLGEYMSQVQCANNFNIRKGDISSCLSQHIKLKSIENYIFIYKDEYTSGKLEKMCELYDKSFYIYTKNDCEFIGEFNSLKKCSDYLGLDSRRISDCLKNNLKYASNYIFIYIMYSKDISNNWVVWRRKK